MGFLNVQQIAKLKVLSAEAEQAQAEAKAKAEALESFLSGLLRSNGNGAASSEGSGATFAEDLRRVLAQHPNGLTKLQIYKHYGFLGTDEANKRKRQKTYSALWWMQNKQGLLERDGDRWKLKTTS